MQYVWHNWGLSGDSAYPKTCYEHKKTKLNKEVHKEEEVFKTVSASDQTANVIINFNLRGYKRQVYEALFFRGYLATFRSSLLLPSSG